MHITPRYITTLTLFVALCSNFVGCKDESSDVKQTVFELTADETKVIGKNIYELPDKGLVDEEGEPVSLNDYKGKKLFMTFIYTSCPMKKMCPLLTQKTAKVQNALSENQLEDTRFVVFTFDPKTDTPEKLKKYGKERGIDFKTADFITGSTKTLSSLMQTFEISASQKDDGTFAHNMRVYLVNSDGIIEKALHSSKWSVPLTAKRLEALN
jgi:protein SCO1/2